MKSPSTTTVADPQAFPIAKRRLSFFGLTWDECIQAFFGGNAFVAVLVLALITVFLFREGWNFFGQNGRNLAVYRQAGLEYVDFVKQQEKDFSALTRYLFDIRMAAVAKLTQTEGVSLEEANARLGPFDAYSTRFEESIDPLRGLVSELTDVASAIKTKFTINEDKTEQRRQLTAAGNRSEAAAVVLQKVDFAAELQPILASRAVYLELNQSLKKSLVELARSPPEIASPALQARLVRFSQLIDLYIAGFPEIEAKMAAWNYAAPVPIWSSFTSFAFGRNWLTASFWQDWYGVVPLVVGSLLISMIALALAIPLGVGAAIYVNQVASPAEQRIVKPSIEFISAFPSVVLGFFGIAVLGEALRKLSQVPWMDWFPGFPVAERLNALTAGCLLGLIAVPTIFTLAEDALQNVPRSFKEASFALGATRLQTILRIIVPAGLSGIISAVLLGLGRVIGETMVVLLCAGNRIAIPDFTAGLGVITQPVHTMTGIIAQEMGEVAQGSIHYRALFVVGILLFGVSLLINFVAQKIVAKYRIAVG